MWINRKYFNFLKHKAEANINAECQILAAQENQQKSVARAMEEYSAALKERDELRLRVIELEQEVSQLKNI
jgi:polyhydroxyalkanoate synthesis regulator phasin